MKEVERVPGTPGHEACGCGHEHHHEHGHEEHEHHHHEHEEAASRETVPMPEGVEKRVYILENLGCANCAAKMERMIGELPGVRMATITYATKQLAVAADHQEALLPEFRRICASIEEGVTVTPRDYTPVKKQEKTSVIQDKKADILAIAVGAVMFVAGEVIEHLYPASLTSAILFIAAYVILGLGIIWTAVKNLAKGHVFDENFLMSVATLAAFAIGDFAEAVGVMLFYRVGELFEDIAVSRSRSQIMEAVDLRPEVVNIVHGDEAESIPAQDAKVGDIILIRPGDRIPLDGVIVEGRSQIDTSPVTGEPVPVNVYPGTEVYSGCVNDQGILKMEVKKPLSESMVTRILDSVENAAASKPKIDRFITKFARIYTPVVVAVAVATAVIPSLVTGEWNHWIYTAITFLVISCPCALVLSVPLAFFSGIGAGSKRGILFKGGVAIEALKDVKAIVMDKTGTITKGNFVVQQVVSLKKLTQKQILTIAADCELSSTHPIGTSIVSAAREKNLELSSPKEAEEISGKGIRAVFPEGTVLCGSKGLLEKYGVDVSEYKSDLYGTEVLVAVDGELEGYLVVADVIKPEAGASVKRMKSQNLITAMLTGDARDNAMAVAKETGIDEVHAQLLPEDKLSHLKQIRKEHGSVMFVGDGINDAPVLAGADVGAAMGNGADAAIEAADVVFMTSSVDAIPEAVSIARKTGKIAMQNVVFALAIKFLIMILGFTGYANMWMAVFADTGVAMLCVLNSIRILYASQKSGNA
ncbi:heavy metal translocating P-type ATPase [[Clostridium] scindens]|uniref:heavy metal translocating P-type ATPase n=1 Tax=Clostridium scindens (strain JCM 10418 / VPI 12708) TaxID=29347 RepID=UPI00242B26DF|nr:heavy metal translocating P-type ATPase [[Clostridium] scindens]